VPLDVEVDVPQLHLYVPDTVAKRVHARAAAEKKSVSRYLADLVSREVGEGWPGGFFERVVGGWQGEPLERAPQGEYEVRDPL
jgi:hypothetical protein